MRKRKEPSDGRSVSSMNKARTSNKTNHFCESLLASRDVHVMCIHAWRMGGCTCVQASRGVGVYTCMKAHISTHLPVCDHKCAHMRKSGWVIRIRCTQYQALRRPSPLRRRKCTSYAHPCEGHPHATRIRICTPTQKWFSEWQVYHKRHTYRAAKRYTTKICYKVT